MIWQIAIEDASINRLPYRELEKLLDEELEAKRTEILRQLRAAKVQFGEVIPDGDE